MLNEQMPLSLIGGACAVGLLVAVAVSTFSTVKGRTGVPPSEGGWPFLGVGLSFFANVNAFLEDRQRKYGAGRPFRLYIMGRWWTIVYALSDIKQVLNGREADISFLGGFGDILKGMLPKDFNFISRYHFFVPVLKQQHMEVYAKLMLTEVRAEVDRLSARAPCRIDLFETVRQLVMRMNLRCILGPNVLEQGRFERYYKAFEDIDPEKGLVNILSSFLSPNKKEAAWSSIRQITQELLLQYQGKAAREGVQDGSVAAESVLEVLVRTASAEGKELDLNEVCGDTFAFTFASFTNTFAVLGWSIWELARRPEILERVRGEAADRDLSDLAQVEHMQVAKACVDEVIRLRTPGLFFRKVMTPLTLSTGEVVPSGDFVAFSARYLSTHPDFFSAPLTFDIDRFLAPRDERKAAGPFWAAWGAGRHPCLGARFATTEILVTLGTLYAELAIRVDDPDPLISKGQVGTVDKPVAPVYVVVEKRQQ